MSRVPEGRKFGEMSSARALTALQSQARYVFDIAEFAVMTGRSDNHHNARLSLARKARDGEVVAVHKRPLIFVIVPPEYRRYGLPPIAWWLGDVMSRLDPDYYLALLAAARYWGSSHYAPMEEQVMVRRPRADMEAGRQRVAFFERAEIQRVPTVMSTGGKARFRVSTREATLLDLVRHSSKVGGIENIARIAKDFGPDLTTDGLLKALDAMGQVAVAQRIGFILSRLGLDRQAELVKQWLAPRRRVRRPLEEGQEREGMEYEPTWAIDYPPRQAVEIEELF